MVCVNRLYKKGLLSGYGRVVIGQAAEGHHLGANDEQSVVHAGS